MAAALDGTADGNVELGSGSMEFLFTSEIPGEVNFCIKEVHCIDNPAHTSAGAARADLPRHGSLKGEDLVYECTLLDGGGGGEEEEWKRATRSTCTVSAQGMGEWQKTEVEYRQLRFSSLSEEEFNARMEETFASAEGAFSPLRVARFSEQSLLFSEALLREQAALGAHLRILIRAPTVEGCAAAPPRPAVANGERSFGTSVFPMAPVVAVGLLPLFQMHKKDGHLLPRLKQGTQRIPLFPVVRRTRGEDAELPVLYSPVLDQEIQKVHERLAAVASRRLLQEQHLGLVTAVQEHRKRRGEEEDIFQGERKPSTWCDERAVEVMTRRLQELSACKRLLYHVAEQVEDEELLQQLQMAELQRWRRLGTVGYAEVELPIFAAACVLLQDVFGCRPLSDSAWRSGKPITKSSPLSHILHHRHLEEETQEQGRESLQAVHAHYEVRQRYKVTDERQLREYLREVVAIHDAATEESLESCLRASGLEEEDSCDDACHSLRGSVGVEEEPAHHKWRLLSGKRKRVPGQEQPSIGELRYLDKFVRHPPTYQLTGQDKAMAWRFRAYLSHIGRALVKFVRAVDWASPSRAQEARLLLVRWQDVPKQAGLELLAACAELDETESCPDFVRALALQLLARLSDEELLQYLLQLVQALRNDRSLSAVAVLAAASPSTPAGEAEAAVRIKELEKDGRRCPHSLFELLSQRALGNFELANFLHWYLEAECDKAELRSYAARLERIFLASEEGGGVREQIRKQKKLIAELNRLYEASKEFTGSNKERVARLQAELRRFGVFDAIALPVNPRVLVIGFVPDQCTVMKSKTKPFVLTFVTQQNTTYRVIYKRGDDLRQDMFFMQMLQAIDRMLLAENYDLHLSIYRVLATSRSEGFMEFVDHASTITSLVARHGSLSRFLEQCSLERHNHSEVKRRFMRSCAGYSVLTYVLGVGDRHHENLMVRNTGDFLHIDFGFLLGDDPKHFAPPFKLSPYMVEGMGGLKSKTFQAFRIACGEVYNRVRSGSDLIIILAMLMAQSDLPCFENGLASVSWIEQNCSLQLSEEEATQKFMGIIDKSAKALFAHVEDILHDWKMYWTK